MNGHEYSKSKFEVHTMYVSTFGMLAILRACDVLALDSIEEELKEFQLFAEIRDNIVQGTRRFI